MSTRSQRARFIKFIRCTTPVLHHRAKYRTLAASSTSPKYSKTPFTTFARDGIRTCRPRPFASASIAKMQQHTLTSFDRDGNGTYLSCCLSHRFSLVEPNFDIAIPVSKSCRVDRYYSRSDSTRVNYFVNFLTVPYVNLSP